MRRGLTEGLSKLEALVRLGRRGPSLVGVPCTGEDLVGVPLGVEFLDEESLEGDSLLVLI